MSNPNLDSRYIKPANVDAKIDAQAVTDAGSMPSYLLNMRLNRLK